MEAVVDYLEFIGGPIDEPFLVAKITNLVKVSTVTAHRYCVALREDERVFCGVDMGRYYYQPRRGDRRPQGNRRALN